MIFAPTHPLCHMAYECGAVAHKKGFFVSLVQKQFCVFGDSFCLAYIMHCAPGPFAAGSTWFFLQSGRTVRNRSSSFLEELFLVSFFTQKKRDRFSRLSFRFLSSCLFLFHRVHRAFIAGKRILLARLSPPDIILERVPFCRSVPEEHLV